MEYRTLGRTGLRVPVLSAGAAAMGGEYGERDEAESIRTVHEGIDRGITYWDTSPYYGRTRSEEVLGKALVGKRDQVVLSTKTGRFDLREFDYSEARIRAEVERSLGRLRTDHVDLLIAHDIEYGDPDVVFGQGIPTLHALKREGKARFVGVSGYPLEVLDRASQRAEVDVIMSYSHYCLNDTSLRQLAPAWRQRGVGVISASPLSMGLLTPVPPDWHPAPPELRAAALRAVEHCNENDADLPFLAMQFALRDPPADSTMTGTSRLAKLEANLAALTTPIDEKLLDEVFDVFAPVKDLTWQSGW